MQSRRRMFLKSFSLPILAGGIGYIANCKAQALFMGDSVNVSIKVQDERGQPIPFVTVWQFVKIDPAHTPHAKLKLDSADLWRCTLRYRQTFEFALTYGDQPVPHLYIPVMGNLQGEVRDTVDYADITGKGNRYPRPDSLNFGYTFMRRGYLPGKIEFTLPKLESRAEAVVTLKRDLAEPLETAPYLQIYDRVRYELSDTRKNTAMTEENARRMEGLRADLEQAAQQAVAAGDSKAAARIYARMRYLPELIMIDGRISGFKQSDLSSERSRAALQRAYELDPDNVFIWMLSYGRRVTYPVGATTKDRIRINLEQIEKLIAAKGEAVWPFLFNRRASSYADGGNYAKARELYLAAEKLEPKYIDWQREIESMKADMRRRGIPVPADW